MAEDSRICGLKSYAGVGSNSRISEGVRYRSDIGAGKREFAALAANRNPADKTIQASRGFPFEPRKSLRAPDEG